MQLHRKWKQKGLVCVSVNLDDPTDARLMAAVRKFLAEQRADFDHFILNEESGDLEKLIGVVGPPVVFVFGRDGKLARKFDGSDDPKGEVQYSQIEELVRRLLEPPRPE